MQALFYNSNNTGNTNIAGNIIPVEMQPNLYIWLVFGRPSWKLFRLYPTSLPRGFSLHSLHTPWKMKTFYPLLLPTPLSCIPSARQPPNLLLVTSNNSSDNFNICPSHHTHFCPLRNGQPCQIAKCFLLFFIFNFSHCVDFLL